MRYSKQDRAAEPLADGDAAGVRLGRRESVVEHGRELEPDLRRRPWSTICSSGTATTTQLSDELDLLGLGHAEQPLGHRRHADASRAWPRFRWAIRITNIGNPETGTDNFNQVYQAQRAADLAAGPPHAEVRRVVELLPEQVVLSRATTGRTGSFPTPRSTSRARRLPTFCWIRCRRRGAARHPTRGRTSSTASASMPPTTSRSAPT